ncbi:MAG TPA: crossover junction endodeoxyribonuclease RuvC, partial [Bacteroidetes bacterium]|nr:crossover junction endodeoxyribonuclease RuvC [Bacteroidota bacterium]
FFGKNVQSMLKLGRAQGVCMAAALFREVPIREYAPKKIKMSITGNGNASKEQVSSMLQKLLNFEFDLKGMPLDASDGLAAAVCHFFQRDRPDNSPGTGKSKGKGGWASFIANNPGRVK